MQRKLSSMERQTAGRAISLFILGAVAGFPPAAVAAPVEAPTAASSSGRDLAALEHRWAVPLMFNSFDTNRDGAVSRREAGASSLLASQFDQLDTDRDGKLSVDELAGAAGSSARSGN